MTLESIEDITPYDVYSTLTVRDSMPAEHIKYISDLLMETLLDDNQPDRLTVSQPPRTGKTSLITLSFPFWLILMNPTLNILIVNYSKELAEDFGMILRQLFIDNQELLATRNIYLSEKEYAKSKFRFRNQQGELLGSIKLVGVGGSITGRDVDICICDDLIKGYTDCTPTLLDKLYNWYQNILLPRLEPWSKLFMLGTRWHSLDVIGRLMKEQPTKYRFINLRALEDDGTCIWSNRYDPQFFIDRESEVGERVFNAQYQGQPLDETGDFFDLDWLIFEDDFQYNNPLITGKVRSWDLAYSGEEPGKDNDYTASCKMYRVAPDTYYVTEVTMKRYGDDLLNVLQRTAKIDTPNVKVLLETGTKGGAAKELFNQYKKHFTGYTIKQSEPVGSKVDRALGFKQALMQGKIRFCLDPNQRELLLTQLKGFPLAKHDDLVDALSYAYSELSTNNGYGVKTAGKRTRRRIR